MTEGPQTAGETANESESHSDQPLLSRHASDLFEVVALIFVGASAWVASHELLYGGPVYSARELALIAYAVGLGLVVIGLLKLSEVRHD